MRRYLGFVALAVLMAVASIYVSMVETSRAPVESGAGQDTDAATDSRTGTKTAPSPAQRAPVPRGEGFDFYVLSLSWSPSYCLSAEGANNRQQCGLGKSYGLVVHGLWPQFERGYPEFCSTNHPDRVPESLGERFLDILPGMGLIGHQWRKHGSCSGLNQEQYLDTTRRAFQQIKVPDELRTVRSQRRLPATTVEDLFLKANPGLSGGGIAVTCAKGRLDEVRICLTRDLRFRDCREVDQNACRAASLTIPPAP